MAIRRNLFGLPPPLLAALPRATDRNSTLARREARAAEEARLARRIDQLRNEIDTLSNTLLQPNPPAPGLRETERLSTLAIVNAGRKARNEPLLTERDIVAGPEQPRAQKIDPGVLAAHIVHASRVARGEVKTLPPRGTVAREIVLAGMKARGERLPEDD
jgi:hypothetical protein